MSESRGAVTGSERRELLARMLEARGIPAGPRVVGSDIPVGEPRSRAPLSFSQEGLWFLDRLSAGGATYSVPGTVRLTGRLDLPALERALNEIARRHASLRTTFAVEEGRPVQVVAPPRAARLRVFDLEHLPSERREPEARRLAAREARHSFDLGHGPLFRSRLARLDADDHVLMVNVHHIVADGWSMGILTHELTELYRAFSRGEPSPLPDLRFQYADFAVWQRERLSGGRLERELEFWQEQLAGEPPSLELPIDRARPPVPSYRGLHQALRVGGRLTGDLKRVAREERASLYMVLLAGFCALLFRYGRQTDLVVGSSFANRSHEQLEDLIGFFVNTLPVRIRWSGDPTFRELLKIVRDAILAVSGHQEVPPAKLVSELQPARDLGRNPLYQVVFDLLTPDRNPPVYGYGLDSHVEETRELPGLRMTPFDVEGGEARFDIAVFLWDMPAGLEGSLEYRTDLFDPSTIARLTGAFEELLGYVVEARDSTLSELAGRLEGSEREHRLRELGRLRDAGREKLKLARRKAI